MLCRMLSGLVLTLICYEVGDSADWPAFRGPHHDGVAAEREAPVTWSADENVVWKISLPHPGNGSPVVAAGRVFVTSAEDSKGHRRSLYCLDRKTGSIQWVKTVTCEQELPTHATNPYCGTTPVVSAERVVVWHGTAGLHCYDFNGNEIWSRDFGEFRHIWGYGTSPIVHQGRVILHSGPGKQVFVISLDLDDGQTIWKVDEPVDGDGSRNAQGAYMGSWATPIVAHVGGKDQLIVAHATRLTAYRPSTGDVIWTCRGLGHSRGDLAYCSPTIVGDLCFMTGGYRGPMFAVKLGGHGDVTETHRLWRVEKQPQSIGSPVAVDGVIYRPNAGPGTIECIDPQDGSILWSDRAAGGNHWSSIVRVGNHLYATNQEGTTVVFSADRSKYRELARNALGDATNATPAVAHGNIFFRTAKYLWCIQ